MRQTCACRTLLAFPLLLSLLSHPLWGAPARAQSQDQASQGGLVMSDSTPPRLDYIRVRQGVLEVTFSEEPDVATTDAILVDGAPLAWSLDESRYTLTATAPLSAGAHTLSIGTGLQDLAGNGLPQAYTNSFTSTGHDTLILLAAPDPRRVLRSTVGNRFGFKGLPVDEETGLIYVRNRYYDPELGRFITADPKGYIDGPSMYAFVGNDPVNRADPRGTDALWVTNSDGSTTLLIPVQFSGRGATPENVSAIVNKIDNLSLPNPHVKVKVVSTSAPIGGVLNKMDFSPGYDTTMCGPPGECANRVGGDRAHINSSNDQSTDAAAHDVLHFAGIEDKYEEGPRDAQGNRTSRPSPGYDDTNVMTSRSGTELKPQQLDEAKNNRTTKRCRIPPGSSRPVC